MTNISVVINDKLFLFCARILGEDVDIFADFFQSEVMKSSVIMDFINKSEIKGNKINLIIIKNSKRNKYPAFFLQYDEEVSIRFSKYIDVLFSYTMKIFLDAFLIINPNISKAINAFIDKYQLSENYEFRSLHRLYYYNKKKSSNTIFKAKNCKIVFDFSQ